MYICVRAYTCRELYAARRLSCANPRKSKCCPFLTRVKISSMVFEIRPTHRLTLALHRQCTLATV